MSFDLQDGQQQRSGGTVQRGSRLTSLKIRGTWLFVLLFVYIATARASGPEFSTPNFRVVALAEGGGIHQPFVEAAKVWLNKLALENNFAVDYIQNTDKIDEAFLSRYQLFIQLNYPPYNWTPTAAAHLSSISRKVEEGGSDFIMPRC